VARQTPGSALMQASVSQLRDIHGIDPVPWWPPAPGWWLLMGLTLAVALGWWAWRRRPPRNWRREARLYLSALRQRTRDAQAKVVASELSELLRRVAIARHGREACAGLVGEEWLVWLQRNDPKGFDWVAHGRALLDLPYAPPGREAASSELRRLIDAAAQWTYGEAPAESRRKPGGKRWRRLTAALRQRFYARFRPQVAQGV
jgi:hypothetical protein